MWYFATEKGYEKLKSKCLDLEKVYAQRNWHWAKKKKKRKQSPRTLLFPKGLWWFLGKNNSDSLAFLEAWYCSLNEVKIKFSYFLHSCRVIWRVFVSSHPFTCVCCWRIWILQVFLIRTSSSSSVEYSIKSALTVEYSKHCATSYLWNFKPFLHFFKKLFKCRLLKFCKGVYLNKFFKY